MTTPQSGIFAIGPPAQVFLEFRLTEGAAVADLLRRAAVLALENTTTAAINLVVGVRPSLMVGVMGCPLGVVDFSNSIVGPSGFTIPATQADVWFWIASNAPDRTFEAARRVIRSLIGYAQVTFCETGWIYHGNQDLTGFIDGTENPPLSAAPAIALFPAQSILAGSSLVLVQRWRHNLEAFENLSSSKQELVFGRTKVDSIEFDDDQMPPNSHVARTSIPDGDSTLQIFRRSIPWGTPVDNGLVFIAFTNDQPRITQMLENMAGVSDGIRDALTHYSTPETGSYFLTPSMELLRSFVEIDLL